MDTEKDTYRKKRMAHWDQVYQYKDNPKRVGAYYQKLIQQYYRFLIPPGLRILELGCAHGDLLAHLQPSFGVGIDFSKKMLDRAVSKYAHLYFVKADVHDIPLKCQFDVILLSDLVNDIWDLHELLKQLHPLVHPGTRLIINYFNNLWRIPLSIIKLLKLGFMVQEQNWFSPHDVINLLNLSDFELIRHNESILFPIDIPYLSGFFNKYLAHLPPFKWLALTNILAARPRPEPFEDRTVSIIIPARNEAGNIESIIQRTPELGKGTELIFVEGHSQDNTFEVIQNNIKENPEKPIKLFRQTGKGKGDAVRLGFESASGDILMILDADMTVPPEDLRNFYDAIISGKGEFINGVRLVYPMEDQSMRFLNILGNKFFSLAFSWLLGQPIKDTLCGTKVLWKKDYQLIADNRSYFGEFDPFGDFDLLFGAAKLNLKIVEMPVRYRSRKYGETNIQRWHHGWLLLKMVVFAAKRIKFI